MLEMHAEPISNKNSEIKCLHCVLKSIVRTLCAFMCEIHNSDSIGFELHWIRRHIGTPWLTLISNKLLTYPVFLCENGP